MGRDRASYVFVDHFGSRDEDVCCSLSVTTQRQSTHAIDPRLDARRTQVTGSSVDGKSTHDLFHLNLYPAEPHSDNTKAIKAIGHAAESALGTFMA
jgi:hypothetical protein